MAKLAGDNAIKTCNKRGKLVALLAATMCFGANAATVGQWSFGGSVGDSVPVGMQFANKVDGSKFPAVSTSRYGGTASSAHLSSIAGFDTAPFNYYRATRFGTDVALDTSLHLDGAEGGSQGCPLYINDSDGDLELTTYTLEFFVRLQETANHSSTGNAVFFSKVYHDFGGETGVYWNGLVCAAGSSWSYHYCCTSSGTPVDGSVSFGTREISDGQWHHLALQVNDADNTAKLYIDHSIVGTAQTLPGSLAYGYDGGGSPERTPWVIGNHQTLDGYSWSGDIAEVRLSDAALDVDYVNSSGTPAATGTSLSKLCRNMMWQGSSIANGETIMHLSFDGNFDALDWSHLQTTNGAFESGVNAAIAGGVASFARLAKSVRKLVDGNGNTLREENKGCLSLNGGCVELAITPFHPDMYQGITIEFFIKAKSTVGEGYNVHLFAASGVQIIAGGGKFRVHQATPINAGGVRYDASLSASPFDDVWHHVALVVKPLSSNAKQGWTLYFDHEKVCSSWDSGVGKNVWGLYTLSPNAVLRFGLDGESRSTFMIDEFRVTRGELPVSSFMRQAEFHKGTEIVFR